MSKISEKINRLKNRTYQLENKIQKLECKNQELINKAQQLENLIETQNREFRGHLANLIKKLGVKDFPKI